MKFSEILNDFLQGKEIRRQHWNRRLWVEYDNTNNSAILRRMEDYEIETVEKNLEFSIEDILAENWEIV